MSALPAAARVAGRVRAARGAHPEWPALVLAAGAWVAFAVVAWGRTAGGGAFVPALHVHGGEVVAGGARVVAPVGMGGMLVVWLLMCTAMMTPTAMLPLRYAALGARAGRRQVVAAAFLLGYLGVWAGLGVPVAVGLAVLPPVTGVAAVGLVAAAALWELTRAKRRALLRCHRTRPIRFAAGPDVRSALRFGGVNGMACVVACGPAMVALMAVGHPVLLTLGAATALLAEKHLARGARLLPAVAAAGLLAAATVA